MSSKLIFSRIAGYDDTVILENISFDVHEGERFVILGGSGCGKSTLIKTIIGLESSTDGHGQFLGFDITGELSGRSEKLIQELREEFWENVIVPGTNEEFNQSLERAGRVADFLEFGELMIVDALARKESCGCHLNEAYQTEENEALRDDEKFCHAAVWEYMGDDKESAFHKEPLTFENVELTQRSYK